MKIRQFIIDVLKFIPVTLPCLIWKKFAEHILGWGKAQQEGADNSTLKNRNIIPQQNDEEKQMTEQTSENQEIEKEQPVANMVTITQKFKQKIMSWCEKNIYDEQGYNYNKINLTLHRDTSIRPEDKKHIGTVKALLQDVAETFCTFSRDQELTEGDVSACINKIFRPLIGAINENDAKSLNGQYTTSTEILFGLHKTALFYAAKPVKELLELIQQEKQN